MVCYGIALLFLLYLDIQEIVAPNWSLIQKWLRQSRNPEWSGCEFNQLGILCKLVQWIVPRKATERFDAKRNVTELGGVC
jgi:hypothetical protein